MLSQESRPVAIMLAFFLGFASIGAEEIPKGVLPQKMPERRQLAGTGVTTSTAPTTSTTPTTQSTQPTTSDQPTTSNTGNGGDTTTKQQTTKQQSTEVPTSVAVTTTNANGNTVTTHVSTNTLAPVNSKTNKVQTETGSKNSVVKVGSKTIDPATLKHKTTVKQPLVAKETRHATHTSYWTSNGHVYSSIYTTENVFKSTTGFATATINPSLANGGGDGSNLSSHTKAIIGGVVGGIGGAILIGGLAFVAWRLWGKKKQEQQDDVYSSPHDSISWQKRSSGNTLDTEQYSSRYNNPSGPVNTASNF